jgi:nitrogen fixation/metabolism regulation signal transduction histidine kinase
MLIRMTLRVSGPAMVLSNHIKQIIGGRYPYMRPLRKDDELQDLYRLFSEMVEVLKERDKK